MAHRHSPVITRRANMHPLAGRAQTPEHIAKRTASLKGRVITPEWREKLSASLKGRPKPPRSEAHKAALSAALKGRPASAAAQAAAAAARLGKKRPDLIGNTFLADAPIKGDCVYCGKPAQSIDHVVPGDESHLVPACYACNRSKQSRTPEQWLAAGLYGAYNGATR